MHPYKYSSDTTSQGSKDEVDSDIDYFSEPETKSETKNKSHRNPYSKRSDDDPADYSFMLDDSDSESKSKSRDKSRDKSKDKSKPDSGTRYSHTPTPSRYVSVEDDSCISVSKHFADMYKKTSRNADPVEFKYLLKRSPIPVLLHYLHYLFYINTENLQNTKTLMGLNDKYNIVSRYFLKAMRSKTRKEDAMSSLRGVSKMLSDKKYGLKDIDDIIYFTPEFITMVTIQSGDLKIYERMVSEWDLFPGFKRSCDLIAAFFGVKTFFSDKTMYENRQNLIISCICGGSVKTLSKIVRMTDKTWLSDYTMRKTREICKPPRGMLEYLEEEYNLVM